MTSLLISESAIAEILWGLMTQREYSKVNTTICNSRDFIGSYDNATYALSVSAIAEILWGLMTGFHHYNCYVHLQ